MRLHMNDPFPDSIDKGIDYGEIDPVMIDADIYGWASRAAQLSPEDKVRLDQARAELNRSISTIPPDAQPYYVRLVRIAELALQHEAGP